jgi:ubiquinone/menaquinone biosynthesis C-methylase UbiE
MNIEMEWADIIWALIPSHFSLTQLLFQLETTLKTPDSKTFDSLHITRRLEYPWIFEELNYPMGKTILDVGAGKTVPSFLLASQNIVHTIDVLEDACNWINEKRYPNIYAHLCSATDIKFDDNYFDITMSISVLEHLPKDDVLKAIREMVRVTKPGGQILITMDVVKGSCDKQVDMENFKDIAKELNMKIPKMPRTVLLVPIDKLEIYVACIQIIKS